MIKLTEKLYDGNSYLTEFCAEVISCEKADNFYKVILNKTAFFPEEGGQYSDRGFIGESFVSDVQIENGEIVHYCSLPVSGAVHGKIDFDRRFRNMQNHTGEHIISGLINSLFNGENVGFHLGEDEVTCDYDILLTDEQLKTVELLANKAVYSNLKITAEYPTEEVLKATPYRSKKEINESIRLVTIDTIDCCACCAPHVKTTAEVGIIKILSAMKLRGGVRLFIACGLDAYNDYVLKHNEIKAISALLAAKPDECKDGVERLQKSLKDSSYTINTLSDRLIEKEIKLIEKESNDIIIFLNTSDQKLLRETVNKAKEKSGNICAAFSGNDNDGYFYILYSETADMPALSKSINQELNGRGGGKPPMIQGSVFCKKSDIEHFFKNSRFFDFTI